MTTSLPASWYRNEIYDRECSGLWRDEWLMFAPAAKLATRGQYVADEVAGFPVFGVVEPDGSLRGLHNVCPHRAGVIMWPGDGRPATSCAATTAGRSVGTVRCAARDFGDDPGLCPERTALASIHVERWRNMVFVQLGDNPSPLAEALAPLATECDPFDLESFTYARRIVRELACNWKTYADNYLEGYHVAMLHPSLSRALDMSTYRVDVPHDSYCIHRADTSDGSPAGGAWLFRYPNLAVNVYAEGMNVERIMPVGHDRTQIVYDYFGADPDQIESMLDMSNVVLDEDQAICEAVQRNLDAGIYEFGRLSPKHERSVAWFQGRVAAAVGPSCPD